MGLSAKVSAHRHEFLMQWAWSVSNGYAVRGTRVGNRTVHTRMHRSIMGLGPEDAFQVDHANGDTLDNRDGNLRVVTRAQNMMNRKANRGNTTGVKGVSLVNGKYKAYINLGSFDTLEEARSVREKYGRLVHGEFHREG